ncbi:MAG: stage 0 sporulation family protein [Clostridia bacterium]|nr:stage 0 sporulation family protein [Clostridia bacterium]MBO4428446.1 stage 0 sporulation family protein [Clostridia bacterium]
MEEVKEKPVTEATEEKTEYEIIGLKFKNTGKMYYFDANGITLDVGDRAIVETARGVEYGFVTLANKIMPVSALVMPLRPVLRKATSNDTAHYEENLSKETDAAKIFEEKIVEHKLEMKLVDVEYTFDNSKLLFYFTSDGRVDFRELVKDLASIFKTRIELRQIGIRDETKMLGGIGVCGRPYCCKKFLDDFAQVSIKMAKEQNLSLNSQKISGACGRLMCCLRYEHEAYEDALKNLPKADSAVNTPDGVGTVAEVAPLTGIVKVKFLSDDKQSFTIRQYPAERIEQIPKGE